MADIKLPPLPVPTLIADSPAGHTAAYSPAQLRARDIEVARVVLEAAAAHIVELPCECCWPDGAGSVAEDFAADILTLVFTHD